MNYYNRKKYKRRFKWIAFFTIILIIGIVIATKFDWFKDWKDDIYAEKVDEIKNKPQMDAENKKKGLESLPRVTFDDYTVQPEICYSIYERPVKVKGIFVNSSAANNKNRLDNLIKLANETEINAMVIDVKDDSGNITFKCNIPLANEIKSDKNHISDIEGVISKLRENNIYPIARIVCFKDPYLSEKRPDLAIKNKDGSIWRYKGISWLNPYNKDSWKYIVDIAKEAVKVGFKEIQFDYIRFEATRKLDYADLGPISKEKTRIQTIKEFAEYAVKELKPYGVKVSADVFGTIITSKVDAKRLGQGYIEMAKTLNYICPMLYPSHYGYGYFGAPKNKHSDLYPYKTIRGSLEVSNKRYEEIKDLKHKAIIRPWLQAFTASYLKDGDWKHYGAKEIRAQIQAVYDAGLQEWILWNSASSYSTAGLLKEENIK